MNRVLRPRVLISGAGIAGLSLGYWLQRMGIETVVVDHAARFQALGHYIALKGNGVEVVREMGLERACRDRELKLSQLRNMTAGGSFLRMGSSAEFDQTLGGYVMLRRADLAQTIFEAVRDQIDLRYGTEIRSVREAGDQVEVELSTGTTESFDFVFGADGIHSRTRRLVFGDGFEVPLGGRYIALTEDYAHGLEQGNARVFFGRGKMTMLMPTSANSVSAVFYHGADGLEPKGEDAPSIKEFLLEAYRDFSPQVVQVISALRERSFVFMDVIAQVRLPSIVKGRIALLGDAAHCPTFMSGMGASLALQGARLLAHSLEEHWHAPARALAEYESAIDPIAARYQASALQMRTLILDRRPWVGMLRDVALRITPDWAMNRSMRKFYDAENLGPGTLASTSSSHR